MTGHRIPKAVISVNTYAGMSFILYLFQGRVS